MEGVTGTVSYNPGTNTLSLSNATLTTPDVTQAIWNLGIDGLKIVVNGTCDLNTPYCIALRLDANTTIEGTNPETDTLKVRNAGPLDHQVGSTAAGMCYRALTTFNNSSLTISDCCVEAVGAGGIILLGTSQLTLNHARLSALSIGTPQSDNQRAVMLSFQANVEPILNDCELVAPEGVYFDASLGGYTTDGSQLTREKVVIDIMEPKWPNGTLPGKFSVAENKQVYFSQGNLQYQASTDTWRFAENQNDYIGDDNVNISPTYDGWIDLFGWGTGDNPTKASGDYADYTTFTDWGVNAISNGGNQANLWRTLTADEWYYLLKDRPNAPSLLALGSINNELGIIILPDDWVAPSGATVATMSINDWKEANDGNYYVDDQYSHTRNKNKFTSDQWAVLDVAGAVFLPFPGRRRYDESQGIITDYAGFGFYWSSTQYPYSDRYAYDMSGSFNTITPRQTSMALVFIGHAVRLVQNCEALTAIDNTSVETRSVKRIVNGQLYLIRGNKTYTVTGQEVK